MKMKHTHTHHHHHYLISSFFFINQKKTKSNFKVESSWSSSRTYNNRKKIGKHHQKKRTLGHFRNWKKEWEKQKQKNQFEFVVVVVVVVVVHPTICQSNIMKTEHTKKRREKFYGHWWLVCPCPTIQKIQDHFF